MKEQKKERNGEQEKQAKRDEEKETKRARKREILKERCYQPKVNGSAYWKGIGG